uniref:MULE transposase domain-containing protein n=1 Tax=Noccaea caerulescens TaxID=107243 RepID=A0A1J3G2U0_NOCCA
MQCEVLKMVKCAIVADKDKGVSDDENVVDGDETDATGALQPESPVDDNAALKKKKKKKVTDCEFIIYCSFENSAGKYLIKTFNNVHSCIRDGCNKVIKGRIIAKLFLNEIRRDPTMKPKAMQAALEEKHNLIVTNDQCRKARKTSLSMIQDEQDEQFSRLKDYKTEILKTNPDSTVEVATITNSSGLETFDKVYVCFPALKRTRVAHCRPIFGIDGCFLKNNVKGQLLAAVGRDANNQFFPVAWAIVQVENTDNWLWFIKKLKHDLGLKNGEGFTLISDRQKVRCLVLPVCIVFSNM